MAEDSSTPPDIEAALAAAREFDDQSGFLRILAIGKLILPQLQPLEPGVGWRLPSIDRGDARYVLAFSSQQRLADSGVQAAQTVTATGGELGATWPQDEDLWLAINLGSEQSVALPPDAVRALPSMVPES